MGTKADAIKVLVVEDETIIASDIIFSLDQLGYKVVGTAVSGREAIRATSTLRPDIVLMDIVLQDDMDGIQSAGHIRSKFNIPVIYLSAYAEEKVLERVKQTDPFGYLIKPFQNNELHFSIQMALYKYRAEEELKRVNRALKTLGSCNNALIHATRERGLLDEVCRIIVDVGGYALAFAVVRDSDSCSTLRVAASAGEAAEYLSVFDPIDPMGGADAADNPIAVALRSGMPIAIQDISADSSRAHWNVSAARHGFGSCIALPLISENTILGALGILAAEPGAFDPDEFDLLVDLSGNLSHWLVSLRAREAHKKAEAALQASHERFIAVMDSIEAVVYVADMRTHEMLFANKCVRDTFDFDPMKACWQIFSGDSSSAGPCAFCTNKHLVDESGMSTGVYQWEYLNPVSGRWFDIRDRAIRWVDGRLVRLEIATDITNRKLVEEELKRHREHLEDLVSERTLELTASNKRLMREMAVRRRAEEELLKAQKLESMGILAGGIAHDFNNVLTTILSNISLAKMHVPPVHEAHGKLIAAEKSTLRARDLTQQLLTFSRSGVPVKKTASVVGIIKDSAEFVLMGSNSRLNYDFPPDVSPVEVDKSQIGQVVSNLIINADQAMPKGGNIWISVRNSAVEEGEILATMRGRFVKLTVRDEGIGIPRENLTRIFDPYFTTKKGGSGLGLASTYSIIKNHGGYIFVESEPGGGTAFTIYLPASDKPLPNEAARRDEVVKGSGRILVLDDDTGIRESLGDVLVFLGYRVEFAMDGDEAIAIYERERAGGAPYDAVIMDLTIPGGMGGVEALRRLLAVDPSIKAIVSSGFSNDPIMSEYEKHGFSGVITKPYQIEDLSHTLAGIVSARTA